MSFGGEVHNIPSLDGQIREQLTCKVGLDGPCRIGGIFWLKDEPRLSFDDFLLQRTYVSRENR